MGKGLKELTQSYISKTVKAIAYIAHKTKAGSDQIGLPDQIAKRSKDIKDTLDSTGITDKATKLAKVTGDQLDKISGAKLLEIVEQRLELQAKYNDILAEKLDEALTRTQKLEEELKKLKRKKKWWG